MGRNDKVELTLKEHHRTDTGIKVSETGEEDDAVWLPLSEIEIEVKDAKKDIIEVSCPEWLARDRGLI